jgi:hypothetical protein
MLLTYVNPNVGFSGASYKAANWLFFGREIDTKYAYLNEDYITLRAISEKVGNNEVSEDHLRYSVQPLEPLEVYAYFVDKALRSKYPNSFNHELRKTPPVV